MNQIHLQREYAPWSAEFVDGTYASNLANPLLKFADAVTPKAALLFTFYIHIDYDSLLAVRLTDGLFYKGNRPGDIVGWFAAPNHSAVQTHNLIYSRQCGGNFVNGHIYAETLGYTLGWQCGDCKCLMKIDKTGNFFWVT